MEPLLYLAHRIPYPPNKGDKIRSHNVVRFLAERYAVHVGTFLDDASDIENLPTFSKMCTSCSAIRLRPKAARLRSLTGLLQGEPLTLPYYRNGAMRRWIDQIVRTRGIRKAVVFSSAMSQYVQSMPDLHVVTDFCDVDSEKWAQYGRERGWPQSSVFRREGKLLLAFEREAAQRSAACVFATQAEAALFARLAPEAATRTHAISNGVDAAFFGPDASRVSPFNANEIPVVFAGAMNYWPNVDAVRWFAREVFPRIVSHVPRARFVIVGMNPVPAVRALASDFILVTGTVPDVRPYLQHARVVVAPMRIARGVQNKVLEAMSMGRPVVAWSSSKNGIVGQIGGEFEAAADAEGYVSKTIALLDRERGDAMGKRARARVLVEYNWTQNLQRFAELLDAPSQDARSTNRVTM